MDTKHRKILLFMVPLVAAATVFALAQQGPPPAYANPDSEILRPNGPGSETGIGQENPNKSTHWQLASDSDDNTYVFTSHNDTNGKDLYALSNHNTGSGTINKVTVCFRIQSPGQSQATACAAIKTGSEVYEGASIAAGSTWTTSSEVWTNNPNTGNPWTWGEIDALEAGVRLTYQQSQIRCSEVYVQVDYAPAVVPTIDITPPSSIDLGAMHTGVNTGSSSQAGTVTCNAASWQVTAKDQKGNNTGYMTSGSNALDSKFQISKDGSTYSNADTGITYTGNPTTLPLYARQVVESSDRVGSYSIITTFTGTIL
jgi:hypothetical protein